MRRLQTVISALLRGALLGGCVGVKPYEKEYLLHPLMDEGELQSLRSDFPTGCASNFERLSMSGLGGASSTSCPTCGG